MFPHTHFLAGILIGLLGYKVEILHSGFSVVIIGFLAVAYDLDHLVVSFIRTRKLDALEAWNKAIGKTDFRESFLHSDSFLFPVLIISTILATISLELFYILFSSYVVHFALDRLHLKKKYLINFSHILKKQAFFIPLNYLEEMMIVFFIACILILMV